MYVKGIARPTGAETVAKFCPSFRIVSTVFYDFISSSKETLSSP